MTKSPFKRSLDRMSKEKECECLTEEELPSGVKEQNQLLEKYESYGLLRSMIQYESVRNKSFRCDGYSQFEYPKGDGSWLETIMVIRGRALNHILLPWLFVSSHAAVITVLLELGIFRERIENTTGNWTSFYSFVINMALSLLLVFRLNRAAQRYWLARKFWGSFIAHGRALTSGILQHGAHDKTMRDEAIRWIAALAVVVMCFIRGDQTIAPPLLKGILDEQKRTEMESSKHTPIYASDRIRNALKQLFLVTAETPIALAHAWTVQLDRLEHELNHLSLQYGAMERIRATPLPIVYVSHLRTFLLLHLLLFPYVFGPDFGWATIPLTMVTAFAFLGVEGASVEVENPFKKGHVNNLNMDALAMALLQNIQQQLQCKADWELLQVGKMCKRWYSV